MPYSPGRITVDYVAHCAYAISTMKRNDSLMSYDGSDSPKQLPKGYNADGYARVYASVDDLKAGKVFRFVKFGECDSSRMLTFNTFDPMV